MSKPTLAYWSIRGRADGARMLLAHLGVDYEDKTYQLGDEESPNSWAKMKFSIGMTCPNLPYWKDGDIYHAEFLSVLRTICRKYKPEYLGRNLKEQDMADAYCESFYGLMQAWMGPHFMGADYKANQAAGDDLVRNFCNLLTQAMGSNKFLVGAEPTFADFCINWGLRLMKLASSAAVGEFPKVVAYHDAYLALPGIADGNRAQVAAGRLDMPPVGWQADHMPQ